MPGHQPEPHRDPARSRPATPRCSDKDSFAPRKPLKQNRFENQTVEDGLDGIQEWDSLDGQPKLVPEAKHEFLPNGGHDAQT